MVDFFLLLTLSNLARWAIVSTNAVSTPTSDFLFFNARVIIIALFVYFLPDKVAIKEYEKASKVGIESNFFLYYLPARLFDFLGGSPRAGFAFLSNILVWLASVKLYNFSKVNYLHCRKAQYMYLVVLFYPDFLYFTAMSLRDVGIAVFSLFFLLSVFFSSVFKYRFVVFLSSVLLILSMRSELLLWIMVVIYLKMQQNWRYDKVLVFNTFFLMMVFFFIFQITQLSLEYIGWHYSGGADASDVIRYFMDMRYERQFGDSDGSGSTSPVLPPEIYYQLHIIFLFIAQSLSFIFVSLAPSNSLIYVSIITGIPIVVIMYKSVKHHSSLLIPRFLTIAVFSSYAIYGFFLVNGGNAFRLRLTLLMLSFLLLSLLVRSEIYADQCVVRRR